MNSYVNGSGHDAAIYDYLGRTVDVCGRESALGLERFEGSRQDTLPAQVERLKAGTNEAVHEPVDTR